jgi:hypothetical protein
MGHFDPFPAAKAERPVSVQSADLRRSDREREGCDDAGHRQRQKWIRSWREGACFPSTIRPEFFAVFPIEQGNPVLVFEQSGGAPDVRNWITASFAGKMREGWGAEPSECI